MDTLYRLLFLGCMVIILLGVYWMDVRPMLRDAMANNVRYQLTATGTGSLYVLDSQRGVVYGVVPDPKKGGVGVAVIDPIERKMVVTSIEVLN